MDLLFCLQFFPETNYTTPKSFHGKFFVYSVGLYVHQETYQLQVNEQQMIQANFQKQKYHEFVIKFFVFQKSYKNPRWHVSPAL